MLDDIDCVLFCCLDAIASAENVRIAPSLRSQKGAIWTKNPINFDYWDVDLSFRITGRGRIGADGLVSSKSFLQPILKCF